MICCLCLKVAPPTMKQMMRGKFLVWASFLSLCHCPNRALDNNQSINQVLWICIILIQIRIQLWTQIRNRRKFQLFVFNQKYDIQKYDSICYFAAFLNQAFLKLFLNFVQFFFTKKIVLYFRFCKKNSKDNIKWFKY